MTLNVESSNRDEKAGGTAGFGARLALILIALLWASQLNGLIGLISGNVQSEIAINFHTTQIVWFSQISLLVGTFTSPFVFKYATMYGKKRVLVVITVLGLIGDTIAAVATNYETLLVGRAIAGFYAPSIALVYAMARDVFPRHLVGQASGFLGGGMGVLALGGPFLSGWIIDDFGYRGALWFMVIATAISLLGLLVLVPESPVREPRTRMDWAGGVLVGGGLTAVIYGVGEGADWGWGDGRTLGCIIGGLAAVVAFVVVEGKVAHPMFPISLLGRRRVWATFLVTGLIMGAVFAQGTVLNLLVLMPDIPGLSDGLGWTATKNAWVGAPTSVTMIVVSVLAGSLARRFDSRLLLAIGGALVAIGIALTSQFHYSVGQLMSVGIVSGLGMGLVVALVPIMIIESVSPEEQALGNGAQSKIQGVFQGVFTQIAFVLVARNSKEMQGTAFYNDDSFSNGFLFFAGAVALATLLVPLIPRAKRLDQVEAGHAV
ncbi:MFS transporter [Streptomyces sp. NPDC057376]|uniref:MFS transporter n=1 Tax=unclassified Streptomyces TaxID=2593676 RepID=UPI00093911C7|nr:MFS transporter [Streptomyces sp. CB02414]OKI86426.1 MFS transporter [Streptomyces sp. CB02414]